MIIFDTLDQLESYSIAVPEINKVIEVMDHSTPYDESVGEYPNSEKDKSIHKIEVFLTSSHGFSDVSEEARLYVEICLEGDELVSLDGSVFKLLPGRFICYRNIKTVKKGIMYTLPVATKSVRFIF